ncbi:MAG: SLC13 family permease [Bacteroidales bacterium]|nr:SLC13 family permease [Bacteroidales bacterium]
MSGQGLFVLILIVVMIIVLMKDRMRPGMTLFTVVVILLAAGVIDSKEALAGFSNRGMITVGLLYLVSEGVSRSGALRNFSIFMLPQKKSSMNKMLSRILIPVSTLSAFLNNTPIVIIFAPLLKSWSERINVSSKKILIPLSYATILGGLCTVIGTTTNLVVDGLMISETGKGMPIFEIGKVGLPIAVVGLLYIIFGSRYLLPKEPAIENTDKEVPREYYYDVTIHSSSPLVDATVKNGCIENLTNFKITTIKRDGEFIDTNNNSIVLKQYDHLVLAGNSKCLENLVQSNSFELTCLNNCDIQFRDIANLQVEAVLAPRFPGIGKTLGEFDFFRHYRAIVMAVHRNGERITEDLAELKLREGDTLILLTDESFMKAWGESSVFYLLSETGNLDISKKTKKKTFALLLTLVMIAGAALGDKISLPWGFKIDMLSMAALTAVIMAWSNIFPAKKYTKFISWDVMITIACAFAISKGMINSGMAAYIAENTIGAVYHLGPHAVLAVLFLITCLFTEVITNNAAAALAFPIALEASKQLGVDPLPFFVTICMAASASFLTPIGYQTNLIVQGIGNYKFNDYVKVGLPLTIIVFLMSVVLIPFIWSF